MSKMQVAIIDQLSTEQCCADCGMPISADEAYVCNDCSAFYAIFRDPNGDMAGDDNG